MKRRIATTYAIGQVLLLLAGLVLVFFFAWKGSAVDLGCALAGMAVSFVIAPIFHEFGHLLAAWVGKMKCVYVKCFCFQFLREQGKGKFCFVSPFSADETRVVPKSGGDMQKRAGRYALGGLLLSGIVLAIVVFCAILCTRLGCMQFVFWGAIPYTAYLFLLNVLPLEYASGKTDMLVYLGIKKGAPTEKNMLSAMEIQGSVYAGKTFGELDETLYYDVPQLAEDEPLFAVMLDLRYRYHLEKGEDDRAADCLNRLAMAQEYLPYDEVMNIAVELTYMHAISGDIENAEASAKICKDRLQADDPCAKRALLAYALAVGNQEGVEVLKEQALESLKKEYILGRARSEKILLERLLQE